MNAGTGLAAGFVIDGKVLHGAHCDAGEIGHMAVSYTHLGADEIGCTLLARAVNGQSGLAPAVYVDYSSLRGKTQIPSYEDRSIGETVLSHLLAAGCGEAETSAEADFVLADVYKRQGFEGGEPWRGRFCLRSGHVHGT